ncbi:hypothetical protein ACKGJO_02715 [Gracilimonas sp. Q87]|uniref:hypothetical protein n=1 Tax=Gracilimonas sp. Q87 TaxID=3384766 RepID=UPI0039841256
MKIILITLTLITTIIMTTCEEDCVTFQNIGEENIADIMSLIPLQGSYQQGTKLTVAINLPASNSYFSDPVNLLDATGDETALVVLDGDDLFVENSLTFIKGNQGEYSHWFILPYNSQTGMYELEVQITLDKLGTYSKSKYGKIYLGPSDPTACAAYLLNTQFMNIDGQYIEFTVTK